MATDSNQPRASFAAMVPPRGTPANDPAPRPGQVIERKPGGQAIYLRIRRRDGRQSESVPWSLIVRAHLEDGEDTERLRLIFQSCLVTVVGRYLGRLCDAMDEGDLKVIQEHNQAEIGLLDQENRALSQPDRKAIIERIEVEPPFDVDAAKFTMQPDDE